MTCKMDGCDRPVRVKKEMLCSSHYVTYRRSLEKRKCSLEWCENVFYAKGYCKNHLFRINKGKEIIVPGAKPECAFDGCDGKVSAKGLCRTHYAQQWNGKPLTEVTSRRQAPERFGERNCKTCREWKDRDDFYDGSNGQKQSECKVCQVKRNKRNTLIRQGRHDEAALLA